MPKNFSNYIKIKGQLSNESADIVTIRDLFYIAMDKNDKKFITEFWCFLVKETSGNEKYTSDSTPDELFELLSDAGVKKAYNHFATKYSKLFNEALIESLDKAPTATLKQKYTTYEKGSVIAILQYKGSGKFKVRFEDNTVDIINMSIIDFD